MVGNLVQEYVVDAYIDDIKDNIICMFKPTTITMLFYYIARFPTSSLSLIMDTSVYMGKLFSARRFSAFNFSHEIIN